MIKILTHTSTSHQITEFQNDKQLIGTKLVILDANLIRNAMCHVQNCKDIKL